MTGIYTDKLAKAGPCFRRKRCIQERSQFLATKPHPCAVCLQRHIVNSPILDGSAARIQNDGNSNL